MPMQQRRDQKSPAAIPPQYSDSQFIWRLILWGWLLRVVIILILQMTDAIFILRLSPDSEKYHREGIEIAHQFSLGWGSLADWVDDGWFQFTGLVYWIFGPRDWLMQLINISISVATVIPLFHIFRLLVDDIRVQRSFAIIIMFFPSIIYWSVLMLKDPISLFAIAIIIYSLFRLRISFGWREISLYFIGMMLLLGVRAYLFFVIMMVTPPALLLFPYRHHISAFRTLALAVAAGMLPLMLGYGFFGVDYISESKYFDIEYVNHIRVAMGDHGSGAIFDADNVHIWGNSISGDILAALQTLLAVFAPVNPFDIGSARQALALPLTLIMLALLIPLAFGGIYMWRIRKLATPVVIVAGAVLAVYISGTTNIGALFRWTTQIMPYFLMAITIGIFSRPSWARFGSRISRSWI